MNPEGRDEMIMCLEVRENSVLGTFSQPPLATAVHGLMLAQSFLISAFPQMSLNFERIYTSMDLNK